MNGTYLANVHIKDKSGGSQSFRSVITFNKGREWHSIRPPVVDHRGMPTNCYLVSQHVPVFCNLVYSLKIP